MLKYNIMIMNLLVSSFLTVWASQRLCFMEEVTLLCTVNLRHRIREYRADSICWYLASGSTWILYLFISFMNLLTKSFLWLQFVNSIDYGNNLLSLNTCLDTLTEMLILSSAYMLYLCLTCSLYTNNQALQQFPALKTLNIFTAFFFK
jgi:hypothetical protein